MTKTYCTKTVLNKNLKSSAATKTTNQPYGSVACTVSCIRGVLQMCVITTADTEHPCHLRQFLQLWFVLQRTSLGLRIPHQQCSTVYNPFHLASFICHMLRRLRHCCVCQMFVPFLRSPIPLCGCPSICLLVHQLTANQAVSKLFNLYFVLFCFLFVIFDQTLFLVQKVYPPCLQSLLFPNIWEDF